MPFKKTKVPGSQAGRFLSVRESYESIRVRNAFSAYLLGGIAVLAVLGLGAVAFAQISNVKFSIPLASLPFSRNSGDSLSAGSEESGKFNVLITGVGGADHEGGDLTDTIILASVNRESDTVSLLSLPRDLYVEYPTG